MDDNTIEYRIVKWARPELLEKELNALSARGFYLVQIVQPTPNDPPYFIMER